jgi:chromate transporter
VIGARPSVTLGEIFWTFCRVGVRGFGGAMPWARRTLVEERRWLTPAEFTDTLGLCQFLPGSNSLNLAVVIGARFRGAGGAVAAAGGLLAVPLVIALALGALYGRLGQAPLVESTLRGIGPAAAGLVIGTALRMAVSLGHSPRVLGFLLAAFIGIALLRWPLLFVVLGLAPLGAWAARGGRS